MTKIEKITLNKTIDYSNDNIEYFIKENSKSNLLDYSKIVGKITNAEKTIQIASTSKISDLILDEIYKNKNINTYIILKSFEKNDTLLNRFNEKNPAILREVEELENNFIIIDDISYIFINSLNNKENIFFELDETKTKDLKYIFNYYFWDCAKKEKLVNEIKEPATESPFPPIGMRELDYLEITTNELENSIQLFIPRDKKYSKYLELNAKNKYFSDEIQNVVYKNNNYIQIRKFKIKDNSLEITNRWILKNNILKEIDNSINIIPKQESWDKEIKIKESKEILLPALQAETIEEMEDIKPNKFPKESYIREIKFIWDVLPPSKPNDAKKAKLYNEYKKLSDNYKNRLSNLKNILTNLEKESGVISFFRETNRKVKQNLEKINEYLDRDLTKFSSIDELNKFLNVEFKNFYEEILNSNINFKNKKKRKEAEEKWKNEKEQKQTDLNNKINELKTKQKKLIIIEENDNKNTKEIKKLKKSIERLQNQINSLNKEIEEKYNNFEYKETNNEKIENFNKFNIPKYILPEVGTLYENNQNYFLETEYYEELEKANELKERYSDKTYKVVVKIGN